MFEWTAESRQIVGAALETQEPIEVYRRSGRTDIVVAGKHLIPADAGRDEALWASAVERLKRAGYLEPYDRGAGGVESYWPSLEATLDFHMPADETAATKTSETAGGGTLMSAESRGYSITIIIAIAGALISAGLQGGIEEGAIRWRWILGLGGVATMFAIWLGSRTRTFWVRLRQAAVVGALVAAVVGANTFAGWVLLEIWVNVTAMTPVEILTAAASLITIVTTAASAVIWSWHLLKRLAENAPVWRREFYTRRIKGRPAFWHPIRWLKGHHEVQVNLTLSHGIEGGGEPTITPPGLMHRLRRWLRRWGRRLRSLFGRRPSGPGTM